MSLAAVNFHLTRHCTSKCLFCFAPFHDVDDQLDEADAHAIIDHMADAGVEKINFAGGEPTIYTGLPGLLRHARRRGMVTSIVTNGARLPEVLDDCAGDLLWVGLSVDSASEVTQAHLGRGRGDHVGRCIVLADRCHNLGIKVKLNTVVTSLTWQEDMGDLVRRVAPSRWKAFQVLPIEGQNNGRVEDLLITPAMFRAFLDRHANLGEHAPVPEDNDAMRGAYVMIDPAGRFFGNATGRHVYSDPILQVGVQEALSQVGYREEKFEARGGRYAW